MKKLTVEYVDIDKVVPYENNPKINGLAIEPVANSIKQFGWRQSIVVDENFVIIVGHTRLLAAKQLGLKEVPVSIADDLTDEQARAYRLIDNKVGEIAKWDEELLTIELNDLEDSDIDLEKFDFEPFVLDDFETDFELPEGDKPAIGKMTFTLANDQIEFIKFALSKVDTENIETFGNSNSNGNKLYEVVKQWAERET